MKDYYDCLGRREWDRLRSTAYDGIEYTITMHYLEKYMPKTGLVLDAGSGPGRYSIELASRGYEVVLLDLSDVQLGIAREEVAKLPEDIRSRIKGFVQGDITDLDFPTGHFDAVICLGGTLSHLSEREDRERAAGELARVCRERAPVFVSVWSYLGVLRKVLVDRPQDIHLLPTFLNERLNPEGTGGTDCYYFTAEEAVDLLARKGIEIVEYAGAQGVSAQLREATDRCARDPASWSVWSEVLLRTCNHPSVVGASDHILLVGFA